jgi:hypothetical protein
MCQALQWHKKMCKGGAVSCSCVIKVDFCHGSLIGDREWDVNYASYMQFEKKFAGNKLYVMCEGQEDVSFLHM